MIQQQVYQVKRSHLGSYSPLKTRTILMFLLTESGEDLDWIFETSGVATVEFLEWVCENLHEENVLSDAEIQEWEDLKRRSPEAILSGSRLQVRLVNLKWYQLFMDASWFLFSGGYRDSKDPRL